MWSLAPCPSAQRLDAEAASPSLVLLRRSALAATATALDPCALCAPTPIEEPRLHSTAPPPSPAAPTCNLPSQRCRLPCSRALCPCPPMHASACLPATTNQCDTQRVWQVAEQPGRELDSRALRRRRRHVVDSAAACPPRPAKRTLPHSARSRLAQHPHHWRAAIKPTQACKVAASSPPTTVCTQQRSATRQVGMNACAGVLPCV